MYDNLAQLLEREFHFKANRNQLRELERLYFEIIRRERTSLEEVTNYLKGNAGIERYSGRNRFFALKNALIKRRFPLTSQREKIDTKTLFLNTLQRPLKGIWKAQKEFKPLAIYVERTVRKNYLVNNICKHFPGVEIEELNYYSQYLKKNRFSPTQLKEPIIFIIKEQWDFLKACPCTRYHLCCGYWILNLGFGCPFDCSYCFLQQYTNFPGILLPANLEDFFETFATFHKKLKKPIRIGTGEFCDSLALDHLTAYSTKLIQYFKDKNVHFEMKTKSNNIKNLLALKPSEHIVISWSVNPEILVKSEELATATLKERLLAARELQDRNYCLGFHFDPIIYFEGWQREYKNVIHWIYSTLKTPFAWISLGTLRANRQLKTVVEKRFPKSAIFYGELFLGEDKKLRYPKFLRVQIYKKMLQWIREYDTKTPIYLCMESADIYASLEKEFGLLRDEVLFAKI